MTNKRLSLAAALSGFVCLIGLLGVDRVVAELVFRYVPWTLWSIGTDWLELAFGFPLSKWATGVALLLAAGISLLLRRRRLAGSLAFVALVQLATRLTAGVLKGLLPRQRPFEVLASGAWDSQWFQDHGSSFPSGHAAHFWGLFFPLAVLYPRAAMWLLPLPLFVSAARVAVSDHFLSDVAASAAIAAVIALIANMARVRKARINAADSMDGSR